MKEMDAKCVLNFMFDEELPNGLKSVVGNLWLDFRVRQAVVAGRHQIH